MRSQGLPKFGSLCVLYFLNKERLVVFCWGQYLDDLVKKANVSIFVDKCTAMFVMGVFQGNAKIKLRNSAC